jgi:hypothetical protein
MKLNTILANHPGHQPIIMYDMSHLHPNRSNNTSGGGIFKSSAASKNICVPRGVTFGHLQFLIHSKDFINVGPNEAIIMWCKSKVNGRFDQIVPSSTLISSILVDHDGIMRIGLQRETTFGNE